MGASRFPPAGRWGAGGVPSGRFARSVRQPDAGTVSFSDVPISRVGSNQVCRYELIVLVEVSQMTSYAKSGKVFSSANASGRIGPPIEAPESGEFREQRSRDGPSIRTYHGRGYRRLGSLHLRGWSTTFVRVREAETRLP